MAFTKVFIFLAWISFGIAALFYSVLAMEYNRIIIFKEPILDKVLPGHVIRTETVIDEGSCRLECYMEPNCVSINVGPVDEGKRTCELNNFTDESPSHSDLVEKGGYIHYAVENFCHHRCCPEKSTLCQVGFTDKGYRCVCREEFKIGNYCHKDPVAFFPLNSTYGTREINNRVAQGVPSGVSLAPGPDGAANGSYEFSGTSNSYIEFPNNEGGPLDVRHSMTMLCWVYHNDQNRFLPLFNYKTNRRRGVRLLVANGKLSVRFTRRDHSLTDSLVKTPLTGGWKFVGASYDHCSGNAKLWVDGDVAQTLNIGVSLELATQDNIRMGVKSGDGRYSKGRIAQMRVYNEALSHEQIQVVKQRTSVPGYKNCVEFYRAGHRNSGVYTIDPDNGGAFDVYCDQTTDGGGWTVFQKRLDGSVEFYRGWNDYKRGFGNLNDEYWLGLDKIHRLTKEQSRLRVDLEDTSGNTAYAEYDLFGVADEGGKYKLSLGEYSGTAGDSLSRHRDMAFSTKDRDNDVHSGNCATAYKGAWWYEICHSSNLNGLYHKGNHSSFADGVNWKTWKGFHYSVKRAEMKIKPVKAWN